MANRPVVLVYQEYANLSFPSAAPELGACIVGPAYQIVDYPEDRNRTLDDGSIALKVAALYGGALDTFVAPPDTATALTVQDLRTGAVIDAASVKVYAEAVRGLVFPLSGTTAVTTTAAGVTVDIGSDAAEAGIVPGDIALLKDADDLILRRVVRSVSGDVVTFTSQFPANTTDVWTNGAGTVQFERALADAVVPANLVTVVDGEIEVAANFQVSSLKVVSAKLVLAYRALRTDLAEPTMLTSFQVTSDGSLGTFGKIDARNPLAVGLWVAAQNTTTPISAFGITVDSGAGYTAAKSALSSRRDIYAVALLTDSASTVKEYADDFTYLADPQYSVDSGVSQKFRVAIGYAGSLPLVKTLVETQTADTVGFASTVATVTAVAGGFVDAGVHVADIIRFHLSNGTTKDYPVTEVTSNETVKGSGTDAPGATSFEIVRNIAANKDAQVEALTSIAKSIGNKRAILCWPDSVEVTGLIDGSKARLSDGSKALADPQSGAYLAAAVAGMTAALPSHQGFTNFAVNGIKKVYHTNPYFTDRQLTDISNSGLFVFTQDDAASLPYIVHEVTTDDSALQFSEYMCVKNMDYVSMEVKAVLDDFLGKWNVTEETLSFIHGAIQAKLDGIMLDKRVRIGSRLKSAKITQLAQSSISADRVEIFVEGKFPMVLNTIGLHIVSG